MSVSVFLKCHRKTFHNVVANNVVLISMYRIECVLLGNATFCLALKNCEQPAIVYEWTLCKYKSTPIKSLFHIFALTLIIWVNKQHSYQPVIPSSGLHRPNTKWLRWLCCVKLKPPQISSPKLQTLIYFFQLSLVEYNHVDVFGLIWFQGFCFWDFCCHPEIVFYGRKRN